MSKTVLIIITLGLVVALGIIFTSGKEESKQNVETRDGVQYVTILASGGYFKKGKEEKSDIPTKLIIKTNGAYDCSASLVINSIGYQKILPQTGNTEIDLGIPKRGEPLKGVCGMGMYSFKINFI